MRVIMYHPRFPTHSNVPPELDILPPSPQPQHLQSTTTHGRSRSPTNGKPITHQTHTQNGINTAHSTIYRVSANGIHVNHTSSGSSSSSHNKVAGNNGDLSRSKSLSSNSSTGTARQRERRNSSVDPNAVYHQGDELHEGQRTPTQSQTLAQARGMEVGHLNPQDLGTLTPEEIAKLQAHMLEDLQDADARPLVSTVHPMETLMKEYSSNPNFLKKMEWLKSKGWHGVRRTKGDGDCFYRSFAFAWVERILRARDRELATAAALSTLETTWKGMAEVGFEVSILEDFYDVLKSLVEQVLRPEPNGRTLNASTLLEAFTVPEASNSIVTYVRMITSAELRRNADEYAAFVVHPETQESMSVLEFCAMFVEGMGREADHVQMQALARAMAVNLSVAYLDGSLGDNGEAAVDFVKFENGGGEDVNGLEDVVLLYRPGHYDILEHRGSEHERSTASTLVTPSVME